MVIHHWHFLFLIALRDGSWNIGQMILNVIAYAVVVFLIWFILAIIVNTISLIAKTTRRGYRDEMDKDSTPGGPTPPPAL